MSYHGRLELTWTNKDQRLLARKDGGYTWLPSGDYRISEVRLLRDAGTTGETHADRSRARDNLLIRGDALNALTSLNAIPEFSAEVQGRVKLVYLDPPFNTQQAFAHYDDALEHSVWLTMMRDRLVQLKKLLAPDGSLWVHCDDYEGSYLRVLLDEVYGRDAWIATVVWQKRTSRENRAAFGSAHDYIHVYSPAGKTGWRDVRNRLVRGADNLSNPDNDPRGLWISVPFSAQGRRRNQGYTIVTPTGVRLKPPQGRCWAATEPEYQRLLADNRIYFPRKGDGRPRVKQFATELQGLVPMSWWTAAEVGDNEESKKEILALFPGEDPFATPKPERLMERIIHIATNPGELVLDCFAGSGTTAAVAHKMQRRWIVVEWSRDTLERFTGPRLEAVVKGGDPGGITEQCGWESGGGFRVLDVAPSMFDEDEGQVVLADWACDGDLGEACAAQLGFEHDTSLPPFCGRKGKMRLAVVDGLLTVTVAGLLLLELPEGEKLTVCATMLDPSARDYLGEQRPGSRARKVPDSILADYRSGQLWWDRHDGQLVALLEEGDELDERADLKVV